MIELKDTPCSRACGCWNPHGVCRERHQCPHHKADYEAARRRAKQAKKRYTSQRSRR